MYAVSHLSIWGHRCARLGLASLVAAILLSWSGWNPPEQAPATIAWLGVALIVLGFLSWRKAWLQTGIAPPLRSQVLTFARPLVGRVVLIGAALLLGSSLSGEQVSLLGLGLVSACGVIGLSLMLDTCNQAQ